MTGFFVFNFWIFLLKSAFSELFPNSSAVVCFSYRLWKNCGIFVETKNPVFLFKNNKFTPSSGTILAFLWISTPIERNHSDRLSRAMRLAGIGGTWDEPGKIKDLTFELISGALGSWEIIFKLHPRACARAVPWNYAVTRCYARALFFAERGTVMWDERGTV